MLLPPEERGQEKWWKKSEELTAQNKSEMWSKLLLFPNIKSLRFCVFQLFMQLLFSFLGTGK